MNQSPAEGFLGTCRSCSWQNRIFSFRKSFWLVIPLALQVVFAPAALRAATLPPVAQANSSPASKAAESHDYSRAIMLYEATLSKHPEDREALLGLARAYLLSKQFQRSVTTYNLVLARDPHNVDALTGLGEAYNLLGKYEKAEGPLQLALRTAPDNDNAAWALSRTYYYEHRLSSAQQLLERATKQHPRDYRLWETLGEVQWEQGRQEAARRSLDRAAELNPAAKRPRILLQNLGSESSLKLGFHNSFFLLNDAVGNQILTLLQTLDFGYGSRWRSHLTGEYRRVSFTPSSGLAPTGEGGDTATSAPGATLAANIASLRDLTEFRVNDDLTIVGEAGVANFLDSSVQRPVYDAGFRFTPVPRMKFALSFGQSIVAPTELAARRAITQRRWASSFHYDDPAIASLDLTYSQGRYSDSNHFRGGNVTIQRVLWSRPLKVTAGYNLESLSFARLDLLHGYFNPKRYISNSGLLDLQGQKDRFHFNYSVDLGRESYTRLAAQGTRPGHFTSQRRANFRFIGRVENWYDFTPRWSIEGSVILYRSALNSGTGAYQAHGFLFTLNRRF